MNYIMVSQQHQLIKNLHVKNISNLFCESCVLAKATRISSSHTPGSSHNIQQLSHKRKLTQRNVFPFYKHITTILTSFSVDLKGPITAGIFGVLYVMIFTCSDTRMRFPYFLKHKSETVLYTRSFFIHIRKLNQIVRNIIIELFNYKSDNGTEFVNKDMKALFDEFCVNHQTTSPYSPNQNGIAERGNRTVFQLAIACIHASHAPIYLWPYAVSAVIYILSILPNKYLEMMSSAYILVYNQLPDFNYLRVWGCDCYAVLPEHRQSSFGLKAEKCIFVGYDFPNSLAYLVYKNQKIYKTGHCYFNENLSNKQLKSDSSMNELVQLLSDFDEELTPSIPVNQSSLHSPYLTPNFLYPSTSIIQPSTTPTSTTLTSTSSLSPAVSTSVHSQIHNDNHLLTLVQQPSTINTYNLRNRKISTKVLYASYSDVCLTNAMGAYISGRFYDDTFNDEFYSNLYATLSVDNIDVNDALVSSQQHHWKEAQRLEIEKLSKIPTWVVVDGLPPGRKALKHKWVLKNKIDMNNKHIFKARLTIKGCNQIEGIDFNDTFSPVAKLVSIRLLLSLASSLGLVLWQFDTQNAFPNAPLQEDIYMKPPPEMNLPPNSYLKLLRALYGLKQASREWHTLIVSKLKDIGFIQLISESCLFIYKRDTVLIILALYVDDKIVASNDIRHIRWLFNKLSESFKMTESRLTRCLGMDITYDINNKRLTISKDDYSTKLVSEYSDYIKHIPFQSVPFDPLLKLSRKDCPSTDEEKQHMLLLPYRSIVGGTNYLTCVMRAECSFANNMHSRFMDNPGITHWNSLLRQLAYIRDHPKATITYQTPSQTYYTIDGKVHSMKPNHLYVYVDADYASSDLDSRKSVSGYLIFFNGGIIAWKTLLQKTVSTSTTEAEYKALHESVKEVVWLSHILTELGYPQSEPIIIFEDNTSAISASDNPVEHTKLKHIDTIYHQTREFMARGIICTVHVATNYQFADLLTKAHSAANFHYLASNIIKIS